MKFTKNLLRAVTDPSLENVVKASASGLSAGAGLFAKKKKKKKGQSSGSVEPGSILTVSAPVAQGAIIGSMNSRVEDIMYLGRPARIVHAQESITILLNGTNGSGRDYVSNLGAFNPLQLALEYASSQGAQYQKFKFLPGSKLQYVTTLPSTIGGQVVVAIQTDPAADFSSDFDDLQRVPGAILTPAWQSAEVDVPQALQDLLFVEQANTDNTSIRLSAQGAYIVAAQGIPLTGSPSVPSGGAIGRVRLDYHILFTDLASIPKPVLPLSFEWPDLGASTVPNVIASGAWWSYDSTTQILTYRGPRRKYGLRLSVYSPADEDVGLAFGPTFSADVTATNFLILPSFQPKTNTNANVATVSIDTILPRGSTITLHSAAGLSAGAQAELDMVPQF